MAQNVKTSEEVGETIAAAFAGAQKPNSEAELTTGGIDGPYVIKHFFGRSQADVETGFQPSLHMEDFTYMTTRAVAYYLPAVLRLMMKRPNFELWSHLYAFLKPSRGEHCAPNVRDFEPKQLQAISDWAAHLHAEWQENPPLFINPREAVKLANAYRQ